MGSRRTGLSRRVSRPFRRMAQGKRRSCAAEPLCGLAGSLLRSRFSACSCASRPLPFRVAIPPEARLRLPLRLRNMSHDLLSQQRPRTGGAAAHRRCRPPLYCRHASKYTRQSGTLDPGSKVGQRKDRHAESWGIIPGFHRHRSVPLFPQEGLNHDYTRRRQTHHRRR